MNIFVTSDLHFNHIQPFLYEPRGFPSVAEMNETIVNNWNSIVQPDDIVYNLGDIAMNDVDGAIPFIQRLNGFQKWLRGNHDTIGKIDKILAACHNIGLLSVPESSYATIIKYNKLSIYMSHYPTITANYDEKHFSQHVISLHGHTHSNKKFETDSPFLYNVCLDAHNCYPVPIEEVISDVREQWEKIKDSTP